MRELQKMSATAIAAIPHPVPIKSGRETVALLVPIHSSTPEHRAKVIAWSEAVEKAATARTSTQQSALDAYFVEQGWRD